MDKAALVTTDLAVGARILEILDQAGLKVSLAMWLRDSEYEDWRFALASRVLDGAEPAKAYGLVHDALDGAGFPLEHTPTLFIISMSTPFVRTLRRMFGKTKSVEGMRLGGQMIGDRFVDDAIVYRVR